MQSFAPRRPSTAVVIALMALVAAITGVAAAAPSGKAQQAHAAALGPRGPRGPRGFTGPAGPQGPAGDIPRIKLVESPHETLNPGQNTYDVDPNNFQASCPSGYTVIGTGFNTGIGNADSVINYGGFFVGGFIHNGTSIQISDVYVQATCGVVPGGTAAASAGSSRTVEEAKYSADLRRLAALRR